MKALHLFWLSKVATRWLFCQNLVYLLAVEKGTLYFSIVVHFTVCCSHICGCDYSTVKQRLRL